MDVAAAIDAEAVPMTLTQIAVAGGSVPRGNGGKFVPGAPASVAIMATIQPASGRVLDDLEEGIRKNASFVVWSRTVLRVNDGLLYNGETFRVLHVWPRPADGFYRAAIGNTDRS